MELKKGYKKTEIGTIPDSWEIQGQSEIANIIDSLHQTPLFSSNGFAMVRVTDIKTGNLNLENTLKVEKNIFKEFIKNYRPKMGDIVLSRVGSYGVSSYVETDEPFCMGQNTVVIEPKIPSRYLYFILNSSLIKKQIEFESFGTGYKSLSLKNIRELKIPLPPLPEQKAIAEVLSDTDNLIQALEKKIAKKRLIKQGAMQKLLTPKPGWEVKSIEQIFSLIQTAAYSRAELKEVGDINYIHYGDIHTKFNYFLDFDSTTLPKISSEKSKYYPLIKDGDVILADASEDYSGIGKSIEVKNIGDKKAISGLHTFLLRDKNSAFVNGFKGYILSCNFVKKQFDRLATGLKVFGISKNNLKKVFIPVPLHSEQIQIASILTDLDSEIEQLETKLSKYKQLKQGLMQNLLTGKIRLV
jgi:type I restriction enzyme, S subunit